MTGDARGTTAMIDLGEDWDLPDQPAPPRTSARRLPLILAILLLASLLGGAAVPRYGLVSLFAVPIEVGSVYTVSGDSLYLSRAGQVSAYRLPAGTPEWSAPTAQQVGALLPMPQAGVVLAQFAGGDPTGMVALDARTGRVLWRDDHARLLGAPDPRRVLLLVSDQMRAVDVPTGRTIWERPRGLGMGWVLPDVDPLQTAPPRLAFDGGDGVTEVVDAVSGAVVARARLETQWPSGIGVTSDGAVSVTTGGFLLAARSVVGNRLFVARQQDGGTLVDAYDLGTLAHLWRTRLRPSAFFITDCGAVLCADGFTSIAGIDPGSGSVLWNSRQWREARPLPGGRLLVTSATAIEPVSVVDASDLRPIMGLPGWSPVAGFAPGSWLVARDSQGLRTWFAALDPGAPALHPLGWAWGVQISQCEYRDAYLACPTVHNELRLWRYAVTPPDRR
jgi:PQQ-like domain